MDSDKIPESFIDYVADRFTEAAVHVVVNIVKVKEYRQVVNNTSLGVQRCILGLHSRHKLVGNLHKTMANDFFYA